MIGCSSQQDLAPLANCPGPRESEIIIRWTKDQICLPTASCLVVAQSAKFPGQDSDHVVNFRTVNSSTPIWNGGRVYDSWEDPKAAKHSLPPNTLRSSGYTGVNTGEHRQPTTLSQLHKQDVGVQVAYGHAERAPISEKWTVVSTIGRSSAAILWLIL